MSEPPPIYAGPGSEQTNSEALMLYTTVSRAELEGLRATVKVYDGVLTDTQRWPAAAQARIAELQDALESMVNQHCTFPDGRMNHSFLSANEEAMDLLERLGRLVKVDEAGYWFKWAPTIIDLSAQQESADPNRSLPRRIEMPKQRSEL